MRLNKIIRQDIKSKAIADSDIEAKIAKQEAKLEAAINSAYEVHLGEKTLRAMNNMPEGFLSKSRLTCIVHDIDTNKNITVQSKKEYAVSATTGGEFFWSGKANHNIMRTIVNAMDKLGRLDTDKCCLEVYLDDLLGSVTTLAKLQDIWPEGMEYMPEDIPYTSKELDPHLAQLVNNILASVKAQQ